MTGNVDYLAFFKEEIKHDDLMVRLNTVKQTPLIAHVLGPKKTVDELVPFLLDLSKQDLYLNDDEFLFRLGDIYMKLIEFTGGNHACLIPAVEWLAYQEETVVRDKGVEALGMICEKGEVSVNEDVMPVIQGLVSAEWFTARLSVTGLFKDAYPKCNDTNKAELRKLYSQLAADETPMVRRAAALRLKDFCAVVEKSNIGTELVPVYRQLAQDDTQDVIRVACVQTSLVLLEHHFRDNPEENKTHTLLVITNSSEDRSWRVRLTIAQNYDKICQYMGPEMTAAFLVNPFVSLMKDAEQEVRSAAIGIVAKLAKNECFTQEQFQTYIVPQFQSLALDASQLVRTALASVISIVASFLGKDLTQRLLLNSISELLKDEHHEVRLQAVSHAAGICSVMGTDILNSSFLASIQILVMDNQWRIRRSVVEQVPEMAKQFGPEVFQTKLENMFFNSLSDSVHAVRLASIQNISVICKYFGSNWTVTHFLPKVIEYYSGGSGFSTRLTVLYSLIQVSHVLHAEQVQTLIVPTLLKAIDDAVPNVRYAAVKLIPQVAVAASLPSSYTASTLKPSVEPLINDPDPDVAHLASAAVHELQTMVGK